MKHAVFKSRPLIPLAIALGVLLTLLAWSFTRDTKKPASGPLAVRYGVIFYGLVIDQDGAPIADAEVVVKSTEWVANPMATGGVLPDANVAKTFSVYTNAKGRFLVQMPADHNLLTIEAVRKMGYDQVNDWLWSLGPPYDKASNGSFTFRGRFWNCPAYQPDTDNPAIFPMHLQGSPKPVASPSRGGSDVGCDGRAIKNQPVPPKIPSAGPGAPRTPREIEDAIVAYTKSVPAPR